MLRCALDCCFRMYIAPQDERIWTEVFVGDDPEDAVDYAVCDATREDWEREVAEGMDEDGYMGGVPMECPIYQGEVTPPWEKASDWRLAEGILSPRADAPPPEEAVRRMREEW